MVVKRAIAATVPNSSGDAGADKSEGNDFDLSMLPLLIVIVSLGYLRSLSVHKLFSLCCLCVDVVECYGSPFVKKSMSSSAGLLSSTSVAYCLVPQMHCLVQDRTNCLEHRGLCLGCLDGRPYRRKFNDAIHMGIHT